MRTPGYTKRTMPVIAKSRRSTRGSVERCLSRFGTSVSSSAAAPILMRSVSSVSAARGEDRFGGFFFRGAFSFGALAACSSVWSTTSEGSSASTAERSTSTLTSAGGGIVTASPISNSFGGGFERTFAWLPVIASESPTIVLSSSPKGFSSGGRSERPGRSSTALFRSTPSSSASSAARIEPSLAAATIFGRVGSSGSGAETLRSPSFRGGVDRTVTCCPA